MVKIRLAYMSYFGNSRKCAQALHDELSKVNIVEMTSIKEGESDSGNAEVVFICTPIRAGKVVGKTRRFIKELTRGKPVKYGFIVTHSAGLDEKWSPVETVGKQMDLLDASGMERIADPLYIRVLEAKGPLEEGYEDRIREYARDLKLSG